jgi:ornithine--oxo-acid transaminase
LPGEHGSTYGGNPLAMAVSKVAIQTLIEEGMIENSLKMGEILQDRLSSIDSGLIKEVRGKGLFRSVELIKESKVDGNDLAYELMKIGLLTKATHNYTVRLNPALVIKEEEVIKASNLVAKAIKKLEVLNKERKRGEREERKIEKEQKKSLKDRELINNDSDHHKKES